MRELRLVDTVVLNGRDVKNRQATLILEPLRDLSNPGWYWHSGGRDVLITPEIMEVRGRTVALVDTVHELWEFEHIAFLHAWGVRGVRIRLEARSHWLPFMCARELWQKVQPQLEVRGYLQPYLVDAGTYQVSAASNGILRSVSYDPHTSGLILDAFVRYPLLEPGCAVVTFDNTLPAAKDRDLRFGRMVSARTLGKPWILKVAAWAAGHPLLGSRRWPHADKVVWEPNVFHTFMSDQRAFSVELAYHKVLDACVLSFGAPHTRYLSGTFKLSRSNHALDLEMLRAIWRTPEYVPYRELASPL